MLALGVVCLSLLGQAPDAGVLIFPLNPPPSSQPATVVPSPPVEPAPAPAPLAPLPEPAPPPAPEAAPPPTAAFGGTRFRAALELSTLSFPSDPTLSSSEFFVVVTPIIGIDGGEDFAFEVGGELRLLLFPSDNRKNDFGGMLRRQDWDEASDFGQIIRSLRIGSDSAILQLRGGDLEGYTLGWGHVINRYGERLNPDYHPSGAKLIGYFGPTREEVMVSDIFGARLFAGEVSLDLGRLLSPESAAVDRFHVAGSTAYDFGRAGGGAPPLGVANIDVDAAVYKGPVARVFLETGSGARIDVRANALSVVGGISVDAQLDGPRLSGKLEIRKQQGNYRQAFFGPGYELQRFADVGLSSNPISQVQFPNGYSGYFEAAGALGSDAPGATLVTASLSLEHYNWGRTDADAAVSIHLLGGHVVGSGRAIAQGVGVDARYSLQSELRWRFSPALYALGYGGTTHIVQPDGSLRAGLYAGLGAAVDFTR